MNAASQLISSQINPVNPNVKADPTVVPAKIPDSNVDLSNFGTHCEIIKVIIIQVGSI